MKNKKKIIIISLIIFIVIWVFIGWNLFKNRDFIKKDWKVYYISKYWEYLLEIKGSSWSVDTDSFEVINGTYIKDRDNVYKFFWTDSDKNTYSIEILKWVDSKTFELLNYSIFYHYLDNKNYAYYIKDKDNVYFSTRWPEWQVEFKLDWVDLNTFKLLWNFYAKDNNNIYYKSDKIDWLSWKNFRILYSWESKGSWWYVYASTSYISSNNKIFYFNDSNKGLKYFEIENVDINSFEVINFFYSKDKNNCYKEWKIVEESGCWWNY